MNMDENKHIYLLLTKTTSIFSRVIALFTKDKFTHAAISLDKNLDVLYSFGRKKVFNPFLGGFTEEKINYGVYTFSPYVPCVVIELVNKRAIRKRKKRFRAFCKE